jgi:hypothetical protein
MPILLNGTFGGAGIFGRPAVYSVLQSFGPRATQSRTGYRPGEDFLLDVHVFVSGDVWQHGRSGVQLGHVGHKTRTLWVRIYVPDQITTREQAVRFFAGVLPEAARLVRDRLRRRAPDWPADDLAAELVGLGGPRPEFPEAVGVPQKADLSAAEAQVDPASLETRGGP